MPLSLAARYGVHRVLDGDGTFPEPASTQSATLGAEGFRETPAVRAVFERRHAA